MVNVIPPNHVDDVHVVEPDQHDDVYVVPELVLVNEDEDLEEDKFEEEEDPQKEEDDMEMAYALVKKKGKANDKFYGKLTLDLGNEVRSSVEQGMVVMEKIVEKHGNDEDKVE
uniref:Uncharacterized protein n=1 Tax=Tanacetum cinerariifolium TaxID=118510 RepID=A0A699SPG2_TANCI|nr:hypothetical protein [Tanacetum cinerariifolium]